MLARTQRHCRYNQHHHSWAYTQSPHSTEILHTDVYCSTGHNSKDTATALTDRWTERGNPSPWGTYTHTVAFRSSIKKSGIALFAGRGSIEETETQILHACSSIWTPDWKSIGLGSSLVVKSHIHANTHESRWGSYAGQNREGNGGDWAKCRSMWIPKITAVTMQGWGACTLGK